MHGRAPTRDGRDPLLSRIRDRLRSMDRGRKVPLVGVVIALLYAVGVV